MQQTMSKSKQTTLFQTWAGPKTVDTKHDSYTCTSESNTNYSEMIDLTDDFDLVLDNDDDLLSRAMEESLCQNESLNNAVDSSNKGSSHFNKTTANSCEKNLSLDLSTIPNLPGFDKVAGQLWIYPTNYPVRDYQFNIVQHALFHNTIVALPTGLGKTFIGAVVMYNYYCWYPQGKIVFMAPTKPLVTQQIEACYNIMGIPQRDTAEMTGKNPKYSE